MRDEIEWGREQAKWISEQMSKWQKVPTSTPWDAIYKEEEVVVYIYSIGGVEYYKKVPRIYK